MGIVFLTLRFIGLFIEWTKNDLFLGLGMGLLLLVSLPLYMLIRSRYRIKVESILQKYTSDSRKGKFARKNKSTVLRDNEAGKSGIEYPSFRNQKQGLKWGGGNIHGSTATRGSKRTFLKK